MNQNVRNRRSNDFPELQIGYPERNDVRDPNGEMERIHVSLEDFQLHRTNANGVIRDARTAESVPGHND
jgi:hypothetical protein